MIPIFIGEHSPIDDYNKICGQAVYVLTYPETGSVDVPEHGSRLRKNSGYKKVYRTAINLLKLSGIGAIFALGTGLIYYFNDSPEMMKKMCIAGVFVMLGAFMLDIFVILPPLAFIECKTDKRDDVIKTILDSKTFILKNGQITVSDEKKSIGNKQLLSPILATTNPNEQGPVHDVPFSTLEVIDEVYSVEYIDGVITAKVHERVLFTRHPFSNDDYHYKDGEFHVENYYNYYQNDVRGEVKWYDNIYGRDTLLQALDALRKDKI